MTAAVVVPCFDEEDRFDGDALAELGRRADARIVLVDDGSTDATPALLAAARAADPQRFDVVTLPANRGKGEAVRVGLRAALADGHDVVGYYDADLATPPAEMARLVAVLRRDPTRVVVLGSRVALLGHDIERSAVRHYLGRLYATAGSAVLRLPVYDTQCGAKVLRAGPALTAALATPFTSRWSFDVELIGRLRRGGVPAEGFVEVPLQSWRDVGGSKLRARAALGAGLDLARIALALRRHDASSHASIGASNNPTV